VIDYLMVFGLIALLVALSLPTMMQLAAILGKDASHRDLPVKSTHPEFARIPSSSRLSSVRVQPGTRDRAAPEPRLAH
jgi:hypothetical protein